jgi:hypothetical protein
MIKKLFILLGFLVAVMAATPAYATTTLSGADSQKDFSCIKHTLPPNAGKWVCDVKFDTQVEGCTFYADPIFGIAGAGHTVCDNVPTGTFCRNNSSNRSVCGPAQQAIRDQILKDLGSAPADKVVCREDKTYPGESKVIYCTPSITSSTCTPSSSGNYSVCSDWSFTKGCNVKEAITVNGAKNYICSKPAESNSGGGDLGDGGTSQNPTPSTCADGSCAIDYAPLEPLPGYENLTKFDFAGMLNLLFKLLITLGALLAVGTFVYGGIVYMISGATGEVDEARKRMRAAVWALLLIAGSWLILYTVNPKLLEFNLGINSLSGNPNENRQVGWIPTAEDQQLIADCEAQGKRYHHEVGGGVECY